jgi:hypothetical protein
VNLERDRVIRIMGEKDPARLEASAHVDSGEGVAHMLKRVDCECEIEPPGKSSRSPVDWMTLNGIPLHSPKSRTRRWRSAKNQIPAPSGSCAILAQSLACQISRQDATAGLDFQHIRVFGRERGQDRYHARQPNRASFTKRSYVGWLGKISEPDWTRSSSPKDGAVR